LIIFQSTKLSKPSLVVQLKDILKEKHRRKFPNGILFLHNAPAHWALATQKKLAYLGFQCLDHPHSLDLVPSDYHLSLDLNKGERERERERESHQFSSGAEFTAAAETWYDRQPSEFLLSGLQRLEQCAKKCSELRGEYVE
jgi:hypothetical protein